MDANLGLVQLNTYILAVKNSRVYSKPFCHNLHFCKMCQDFICLLSFYIQLYSFSIKLYKKCFNLDEIFPVAWGHTQEAAAKKSCKNSKNCSCKSIFSLTYHVKMYFPSIFSNLKNFTFYTQIALFRKRIIGIQ